jgi:hypothetical protein
MEEEMVEEEAVVEEVTMSKFCSSNMNGYT